MNVVEHFFIGWARRHSERSEESQNAPAAASTEILRRVRASG
jgi:hypothetical protein